MPNHNFFIFYLIILLYQLHRCISFSITRGCRKKWLRLSSEHLPKVQVKTVIGTTEAHLLTAGSIQNLEQNPV
jgi:hypothetical protein